MKLIKPALSASNNFGRAIYVGLWIAISGCTTYVQETPPPTYIPPPPAPAPVYVAPPPVYVAPPPQPAPVVVEQPVAPPVVVIQATTDFYAPLSPLGQWVTVDGYGSVWVPNGVAPGWRPYCNGHWQNTDAGWFWASDESWGWATYHYGRWDYDSYHGWFWIPQTEWAPAWVSWRSGGEYVGWCPQPPRERFSRGVRVEVGIEVGPPSAFVFVEQRRFLERHRPATVIVNNTTIINKTTVIHNTTVINKTVINEGPQVTVIEKASGHPVERVAVRDLRRNAETPVAAVHPELKIRRPTTPGAVTKPTPVSRPPAQPATAKPSPIIQDPERKPAPPTGRVETPRPTNPNPNPNPTPGAREPDKRTIQRPPPPPTKQVKPKQPAKKPPVKKEEPKKPDGQ